RTVGHGAMAAFSVDRDAKRIGIGKTIAWAEPDFPGRKFVPHVERQCHIRLGEARHQPILDHSLGASYGFLGGLANQYQGSVRSITVGPAPFFKIATTPVPPTCSVTVKPRSRRCPASFAAVWISCDESSGF